MSESTDIQRLIDEATVANKPSRLQEFEVRSGQGDKAMFIKMKQQRWIAKAIFFGGLLVLLAGLAVMPV